MSITQTFHLNLIPEQGPTVVHCDQYDEGTGRLIIKLYDGDVAYSPSGTATIQGKKPDGHGFEYAATLVGNTVTADLTKQMTAVAGPVRCQVVVRESDDRTGTFVFILQVQKSALPDDTEMSASDYQLIEQALDSAEDAEAWAVGERGGVPVDPTDPTYNNNAEYWAYQASQYAQGGLIFKGSVAFASIPTTGMANGDMYNITDDFTTDSRFIEGAGKSYPAGTDIAYVDSLSKWDVLSAIKIGSLDDLTDVTITTPTDGQALLYDAANQIWKNGNVSGGGGDYMGLYGMTEIQSSDGQGTTLLDLDQYTSVGNYFCNGKAKISTAHYAEIGLNTTSTGTHSSAKFLLYVRKITDAWLMQDLYLIHSTGVKRVMHYQRQAEYANNTWTFGLWRADVDTGSVSPDLSPYSLGNGMYNVLVNNIADGDVLTRVNGKWSNVPINKVTSLAVDLTGWTSDTTSQSGTTLYKKQISVNNVHVEKPTISIGCGTGYTLPTVAEQESYNLLQYVIAENEAPCYLMLYSSAIPTTAFYINVEGVD